MGQPCVKVILQRSVAATLEAAVSGRGLTSHHRIRYSVITRMNLLCVDEGNGPMRSHPIKSNGLETVIGCRYPSFRGSSLML